ncbi:MAG: hypothetical protein DRP87_18245, partial [Spirochaetes bacterium]
YTYADYLSWPDDERWELIDGVAYNMSPAPGRQHQEISITISGEIYDFLKDKPCHVYAAPFDVRLPENPDEQDKEITTVVQPDVSVFCDESKLDERGATGAPDIAVEILSPYTSVKDQREKLALYERFGVREYWIVDPANCIMWVYRLVEPGRTGQEGCRSGKERRPQLGGSESHTATYGKPEVYGPEDTFTSRVMEGFSLELSSVFPH